MRFGVRSGRGAGLRSGKPPPGFQGPSDGCRTPRTAGRSFLTPPTPFAGRPDSEGGGTVSERRRLSPAPSTASPGGAASPLPPAGGGVAEDGKTGVSRPPKKTGKPGFPVLRDPPPPGALPPPPSGLGNVRPIPFRPLRPRGAVRGRDRARGGGGGGPRPSPPRRPPLPRDPPPDGASTLSNGDRPAAKDRLTRARPPWARNPFPRRPRGSPRGLGGGSSSPRAIARVFATTTEIGARGRSARPLGPRLRRSRGGETPPRDPGAPPTGPGAERDPAGRGGGGGRERRENRVFPSSEKDGKTGFSRPPRDPPPPPPRPPSPAGRGPRRPGSGAGSGAIRFRGRPIRQVSCYALLGGCRLPWPPSCCLYGPTPLGSDDGPALGPLTRAFG